MSNYLAYDAFIGSEGKRLLEMLEGLVWTYTEAAFALLVLAIAAVAWLMAGELRVSAKDRRAGSKRDEARERSSVSLLDASRECL